MTLGIIEEIRYAEKKNVGAMSSLTTPDLKPKGKRNMSSRPNKDYESRGYA